MAEQLSEDPDLAGLMDSEIRAVTATSSKSLRSLSKDPELAEVSDTSTKATSKMLGGDLLLEDDSEAPPGNGVLNAPPTDVVHRTAAGVHLCWSDVNMTVQQPGSPCLRGRKGKERHHILSNLSGCVLPNELTAIMGHSGAGMWLHLLTLQLLRSRFSS